MKSILALLAFVALVGVSNSAQADVCTARLLNPRGMTVQTFTGHGYDRYEACRRAEDQCQRELWGRPFPRAGARCDVNYRRPRPNPRRMCSVELQGRRLLEVITSHGYDRRDACRNAMRKCQNRRARLQRSGRAYNAQCVRRGFGPRW